MATDAFITTKQGISQFERWFDALIPESVEVDSRDTPDLMRFAAEFSGQINYYNLSNQLDGNWNDFFVRDPNILILLVSRFNISDTIGMFNHYNDAFLKAVTKEARLNAFSGLFYYISNLASRIVQLKEQFAKTDNFSQIEELQMNFPDLEMELQQLQDFFYEAAHTLGETFSANKKVPDFFKDRIVNRHRKPYFKDVTSIVELTAPHQLLVKIFDRINAKFYKLIEIAQTYVLYNNIKEQQFAPQLALFIASLELYSHLRAKINGINRKHLDLYYKHLLGLGLKAGRPDQVLLIIEPEMNAKNTLVTPKDILITEVKGEEPVLYKLESELLVSQIKIAELKTVFKGNLTLLAAKKSNCLDVMDKPIYKASHPLFNPSLYLMNSDVVVPWAVMGEEQQVRTDSSRTMTDANLAMIIGSPLFYLPEGNRQISLKIHLKTDSYQALVAYIDNYNELIEGEIENSIYHLFSDAFRISYTSTQKWMTVSNHAVRFNLKKRELRTHQSKEEQYFEIIIPLNETEPAFDVYNKEVHQQPFDTELPLLRIDLNNFAQHHPFSFLSNTQVERMTIKIVVNGFQSVMLQNNIGMLSNMNPFQVFGAQPAIGSFLDVKNTNLFNCFTKQLALHLEWMDLPRDKGGFATYFQGYGEPFTNESFLAGISALNNGVYAPTGDKQQKVPLFTMLPYTNTLSSHTAIEKIDLSNIRFLNRPMLDADKDSNFTQGVLRMELCSPTEAFGQRLFPKIFPEIVMNNAKMFGKKEPVPNQPIIPMLKSLKVDYTLEYSENFIEENFQKDPNIVLFHLHPFGYEKVFPGNSKKNIAWMPSIEDHKNLMIGLENAYPSAEINLLFQLEDCGFQHTLYEPELIQWSYLANNTWVTIAQRDLIFDSTNNLINSGIVKMRLPDVLPESNTILNSNLFWLRASSKMGHGANSRIISIYNNGTSAIRVLNELDNEPVELCLKPGSIKGFKHAIKGIQQVFQPSASFNGRRCESDEKYYVRTSERLRHKDRPVQFNDIIQMVLEEFPEIMIVKCFNTYTEGFQVVPNTDLQLVLIPKEKDHSGIRDEQPGVSLSILNRVKAFLQAKISPFITIEVGNPLYEKVKIICKVMLTKEASLNSGFFLTQLNTEINRFISPWLFGDKEEAKIGNSLYKSDILLFIKKRAYVEYVSSFSVVHFSKSKTNFSNHLVVDISDTALVNSDVIEGSSPASVFIPSSNHIITLINEPEFETDQASGIGRFMIGDELLIADDNENDTLPVEQIPLDEWADDFFSLIISKTI